MKNYTAENVDQYIASADEKARPHLNELRRITKTTVPEAQESISWGVPFYKYHGLLGGYSTYTNHVSFGLAFRLDSKIRESLEKKGYHTGNKTVQIRFDQKIPVTEIKQILIAKAKENELTSN